MKIKSLLQLKMAILRTSRGDRLRAMSAFRLLKITMKEYDYVKFPIEFDYVYHQYIRFNWKLSSVRFDIESKQLIFNKHWIVVGLDDNQDGELMQSIRCLGNGY